MSRQTSGPLGSVLAVMPFAATYRLCPVMPREGGASSTPCANYQAPHRLRLLDRPPSRTMTPRAEALLELHQNLRQCAGTGLVFPALSDPAWRTHSVTEASMPMIQS